MTLRRDPIQDTWAAYITAATHASRACTQNWIIIPASLGIFIVYQIAQMLFANFGMAGGFLLGFLQIVLLSLYYAWFSEATSNGGRVRAADLVSLDYPLFFSCIGAAFIVFLAQWALEMLLSGIPGTIWIRSCFFVALLILLNPLPEVIYLRRYDGWASVSYSFNFIMNKGLEWLIPTFLLLLPGFLIIPEQFLASFNGDELFLASALLATAWQGLSIDLPIVLVQLLSLIVGAWYMLFRAFLFKALDEGFGRPKLF